MARKLTAVRIDEADLEALAAIGVKEDRDLSYLIRKAVADFIRRYKAKK